MRLLLVLLVLGALASRGTLLHSFAVAFDMFVQDVIWNAPIGVTISSRAGLAARAGRPRLAKLIDALFFDAGHCEKAIAADLERAQKAIAVLTSSASP